ncbi:MAG: hypothetical protein QOH98_319 [Methylobacteriaceae bacterium]|jgi:hypothetical protein|nr:hypothetical protein [Methylobacteriaceae bacterium]
MSRRNAPGPNFEIVPRDRPVTRQRMQARDELLEAQQLGPRLQRIYSPCTDQQPDDMRMLIVALDRKLHAR